MDAEQLYASIGNILRLDIFRSVGLEETQAQPP